MAVCVASCGEREPDINQTIAEMQAQWDSEYPPVRQPPTNEGEPFDVASDIRAAYRLLYSSKQKSGYLEVMTRRDGPSGTSFTRTEIDCENRLYKVRGEGDTRVDALRDLPRSDRWTDLVPGSIKDVTVSFACRKAGQ